MKDENNKADEVVRSKALEIYQKVKQQNLKNNKNEFISEIYYKDLTLIQPNEQDGLAEQDVYLVKSLSGNGKITYQIYSNDMLIADIDENGDMNFSKDYINKVAKIDNRFKTTIEKNTSKFTQPQELSEEDREFSKEELFATAQEEKINNDKEEPMTPKQKSKSEDEKDLEKIAQETGTKKEDLSACTKINPKEYVTDKERFEDVANVQGKYEKIYIISANGHTDKNSKFAFMGITKEGKAEYIDGLATRGATTTDRNIYSINRDGSTIEEKQTTEMFTTVDSNKMFSVTKGQYGILELDYIRRSSEENKFISAPVATEIQRPTTMEVKKFMEDTRTSKRDIDESVKEAEEQTKEDETNTTNLSRVDNNPNNDSGYDIDEEITMHDGTITTLRKEAEKQNISPEEYVNRIENAQGKCTAEKIEVVNTENIEEQEERGERLTPDEEAYANRH